jgi:hypothetical protein
VSDNVLPLDRWPSFTRQQAWGRTKTGFYGHELIPDPEQIVYIEQAFDYIEAGNALRETAEWLSQKIHRSVTHATLANLYKQHRKPWVRTKTNRRTWKGHTRDTKKIISAKRLAASAVKKAKKLEAEIALKKKQLKPEDFDQPRKEPKPNLSFAEDSPYKDEIKYAFRPNPGPQSRFLQATELEVLYGGAAGGGKSYAMIADPMRYFDNPNFVGLLLRRTNDELRELIRETQKLYPKVFKGCKWKEQASKWVFPSGAEFWITYLDKDSDVYRYQGQSFAWIGMDELTQYPTPFAYTYLRSRLRSTDPQLSKSLAMRATTNPGGPGHGWVKKFFVDPEIPGKPFWATDEHGEIIRYPDDSKYGDLAGQPLNKRIFIPAKLSDNPYLYEDGVYERNLLSLSEDQRRKLLDGDWSVMEGAAFPEFSTRTHVCEPFDIPDGWRKFRSGDFGYASHSAVLWFAIDPDGTLYVYRELYVSKKTGQELARLVRELERFDVNMTYGVLDSSVWHKRGHFGPSIAEEMIQAGCRWKPSDRTDGSRIAGKNRLHELLRVNSFTGLPGIIIFNNCRQLIADLPMIPSDPDGGEDIDDKYVSDHTYDALRYGIMSRPRPGMNLDYGKTNHNYYQPFDKQFGY